MRSQKRSRHDSQTHHFYSCPTQEIDEIAAKAEKGGDKKKRDKKDTAVEEKPAAVVEMTDAQATAAKADKKAKKDKLKEAAGEGKKKSKKTGSGDDLDKETMDSPEEEETDSKAAGT